jgi:ubiquinone/menaquinone biosynthesis C-methylase UbiE/DNA-binding transcriptional ArsR family regulator
MPSIDSAVNLLHLFGDATRLRLMALLAHEEFSVAELVGVLQAPQSRVSTHLGRLKEAGLLRDRRVGASTFYALNDGAMPQEARRVWELLASEVSDRVLEADRSRSEQLRLARENARSWPDSIAGQMERYYSPGRTWEATLRGILGFVELGDVLDVGSGDGAIAELLAPRSRSYTCLDKSQRMIDAARERLARHDNVRLCVGDMHQLAFPESTFDAVLLLHTLTYADDPPRALAEAARVLRPSGRAIVAALLEHEHDDVTAGYGHVQPGFAPAALRRWLEKAGLEVSRCEVTSRESRKPFFEVVTAWARKKPAEGNGHSPRKVEQ